MMITKLSNSLIQDALRRFKLLNPKEEVPYDIHKKGINRFLRYNKYFLSFNPILYIFKDQTELSLENYKNIEQLNVYYDYDEGKEDNKECLIFYQYKNSRTLHAKFIRFNKLNKVIKKIMEE